MLFLFLPVFVGDTKIIFGDNSPLMTAFKNYFVITDQWQYIRLKASTFRSSQLKLLKNKTLFTFPYFEAQMKSVGFSSQKQN